MRCDEAREALGEHPTGAARTVVEEPTHVQVQAEGHPVPGQISDMPHVARVHTRRGAATERAHGRRLQRLDDRRDTALGRGTVPQVEWRRIGQDRRRWWQGEPPLVAGTPCSVAPVSILSLARFTKSAGEPTLGLDRVKVAMNVISSNRPMIAYPTAIRAKLLPRVIPDESSCPAARCLTRCTTNSKANGRWLPLAYSYRSP